MKIMSVVLTQKDQHNLYMRKYRQNPEVKEKQQIYKKEWERKNIKQISLRHKIWVQSKKNTDWELKNNEYNKEYRLKNKETILIRGKEYRKNNSEKLKKYQKKYYLEHKELIYQLNKKWVSLNPDKVLATTKRHLKKYSISFDLSHSEYFNALGVWSYAVKKIHGNSCVICGSTNKINSHHILYKSKYPKLSLNTNNGIVLCKTHHNEVHGWGMK
jgi:hypothetical protein